MWTFLLYVILAVGVTTASNQNVQSSRSEDAASWTKRLLLDSTQQSQIKGGFDAATHLFNKMDRHDFSGVAGALVGSVSSFLGAVGPFVGFVLSFFSGPSPEYLLLKKLFTQVETRFDQVDVQFAALRRQVKFVATEIHFNDLEANINAVQSKLNLLTRVTNLKGYRSEKHEFIHSYDRAYEESGIKLYNAIIHGGTLTGGLFHEFMTQSNYDRKSTQRFMIGTLNLLMRAAALEMTYAQLKHDPNLAIKRSTWISHFRRVKSKMIAIDNALVKHYHNQLVIDVDGFGTLHHKGTLSNSEFSNQLYSKLTTKYYWRDWFVLVADTYDSYNLVVHACEYNQHDNHGRTIAVASVDKKKHHVGSTLTLMNLHLPLSIHIPSHHTNPRYFYKCKSSNDAYSQLPDSARNHCNTYAAAGVICTKNTDIHIHHSSGRLSSYNPHASNEAFLFG